MKTWAYLKHTAPMLLADAVLVNLGLLLGLLARHAVLVGLNEASNFVPLYTGPAGLWRDSLRAFQSAAPVLTLVSLVVFIASGLYRPGQLLSRAERSPAGPSRQRSLSDFCPGVPFDSAPGLPGRTVEFRAISAQRMVGRLGLGACVAPDRTPGGGDFNGGARRKFAGPDHP